MGLSEDEWQSVDEDTKAPRRVSEAAIDLGTGLPSTKKSRKASYWRWVALVGSTKTWKMSVSCCALLVNMLPTCHCGIVL